MAHETGEGVKNSSQKSTNMVAKGSGSSGPENSIPGRIGSVAKFSKDMTVDKNPKGNAYWAKRQAASNAAAAKDTRPHAHPINARQPHLKRVKPD